MITFVLYTTSYLVLHVLTSAVHILKSERYREDQHGPWSKDETQNREAFQIFANYLVFISCHIKVLLRRSNHCFSYTY